MPRMSARTTNEQPTQNLKKPARGTHHIPSPPAPFPMIFLNWIDPPIGFDTSGIDSNNPFYRVRIMSVGESGGSSSIEVPFAEPVQWNPLSPSPSIWQFQMVGVPSEPNVLEYYTTMTVVQGAPGLQQVRSRIFTPAQVNHTAAQFVSSSSLTAGSPAYIRVDGVVNASNITVSVTYHHVVINNPNIDPTGPRDLFLQQPW